MNPLKASLQISNLEYNPSYWQDVNMELWDWSLRSGGNIHSLCTWSEESFQENTEPFKRQTLIISDQWRSGSQEIFSFQMNHSNNKQWTVSIHFACKNCTGKIRNRSFMKFKYSFFIPSILWCMNLFYEVVFETLYFTVHLSCYWLHLQCSRSC